MNDKISVIIIIYNVEKYLKQCIESVINQTYRNIEVILVDDGSSDNSGCICDYYGKMDSRVKIIHKGNGGLVSARQAGIRLATGKYVAFVDGDDWIELETYEQLYHKAETYKVDIVAAGIIRDGIDQKVYDHNLLKSGLYDKNAMESDIYPGMMYDLKRGRHLLDPSLCNKLFITELLKSIILEVDEKIFYLGEDAATTYPFMLKANSIYISKECFYHHRIFMTSEQTAYKRENAYERIVYFYNYLKNIFQKSKYDKIMRLQLNAYFLKFIKMIISEDTGIDIVNCCQYIQSSKKEKEYIFPGLELDSNKRIILYGAGDVGKSLYKKLKNKEIMWVDKEYLVYRELGYHVNSVEEIKNIDFDYLIIAVKSEKLAKEIKAELNCNNVKSEKILWIEPKLVESTDSQ